MSVGELRPAVQRGRPARAKLEAALLGIWHETLGDSSLGIDEDFFDAGGHSLAALRVLSLIEERLGLELEPEALYQAPTVRRLSRLVSGRMARGRVIEFPTRLNAKSGPVSFGQELRLLTQEYVTDVAKAPLWSGAITTHAYRLRGEVDLDILEQVFADLALRHPVLNIAIERDTAGWSQRLQPTGVRLHRRPLGDGGEAALLSIAQRERELAFELESGPLVRAYYLEAGRSDGFLLVAFDHLCCDLASLITFWDEVEALYRSYSMSAPARLPDLAFDYLDFAAWERRQYSATGSRGADAAVWTDQFSTFRRWPEYGPFKGQRRRSSLGTSAFRIFDERSDRMLEATATRWGVTRFILHVYLIYRALATVASSQEVVLLTTLENRTLPQSKGVVGLFSNRTPLRLALNPRNSLGDDLDCIRDAVNVAQRHQGYPFLALLTRLGLEDYIDHTLQPGIVFNYLNRESLVRPGLRLPGVSCEWISIPTPGRTLAALYLLVAESSAGFRIAARSSPGRLAHCEAVMAAYESHFGALVEIEEDAMRRVRPVKVAGKHHSRLGLERQDGRNADALVKRPAR